MRALRCYRQVRPADLAFKFLAPKLKEAILFGEQPRHLKLSDLMNNVPVLWSEQQEVFGLKVLEQET